MMYQYNSHVSSILISMWFTTHIYSDMHTLTLTLKETGQQYDLDKKPSQVKFKGVQAHYDMV